MEMPGLTYIASDYRYGFNSKEKDAAFGLLHYDYGFRIYHPGLGRFLSVDPLAAKYAGWSPFNYVMGNPIRFIDPDGRKVDDVVYYDSKGNEVNRIVTNERYETYVDLNDDGNYSLAPMPNIIEGYEAPKYQRFDYLIAAHTHIFNNLEKESRPKTENGLTLDGNLPVNLSPTLVKSIILQETVLGTVAGKYGQNGTSDIMQANVITGKGTKRERTDWGEYKTRFGLTKGESATPEQSIFAGIRILFMKGLTVDEAVYDSWTKENGAPLNEDSTVSWKGGDLKSWWHAVYNYNAAKNPSGYAKEIYSNWNNSF